MNTKAISGIKDTPYPQREKTNHFLLVLKKKCFVFIPRL